MKLNLSHYVFGVRIAKPTKIKGFAFKKSCKCQT
jgi:hypothetical protein